MHTTHTWIIYDVYVNIQARMHTTHTWIIYDVYNARICSCKPCGNQNVSLAHGACSHSFWRLFLSMNTTPITVKDRVLHVAKRLVPKGNQSGHRWPSSCRVLHKRVDQHAGNFWDNVTKTHTIDLSAFNLPGCTRVQFVHIDPVYVWITRCNALIKHGVRIHWDPQKLYHPQTNARLYGGGIQYGNLLQAAHVSLSGTGKVALFNINWDVI